MKTQSLRYHAAKKTPFHRLPFIGRGHHRPADGGTSFWDVPANHSYGTGCNLGDAMAHLFLKHLREEQDEHPFKLGLLMLGWAERLSVADPSERLALHGQMVGFASILQPWIQASVRNFGQNLDKHDWQALTDHANAAL